MIQHLINWIWYVYFVHGVLQFKVKKTKNGKNEMKLKLKHFDFYVKWHHKLSVYINRVLTFLEHDIKIEL